MPLASNNIKAILVTEDFSEAARIAQEKCLTLQHFDYKCQRSRNEKGVPYGPTVSVTLNCTMRATGGLQVFYDRLRSNATYSYSFIFNATFDSQKTLADYEDAMIVNGYIVDVEEVFDSASGLHDESSQMLLNVKILLSDITYVGRTSNKVLPIINLR